MAYSKSPIMTYMTLKRCRNSYLKTRVMFAERKTKSQGRRNETTEDEF